VGALLGILQLDKGEPNGYAQLLPLLQAWIQDAGGFAALGLAAYILFALMGSSANNASQKMRMPLPTLMVLLAILSFIGYALVLVTLVLEGRGTTKLFSMPIAEPPIWIAPKGATMNVEPPKLHTELRPILLTIAGGFAVLGILIPMLMDLPKWRIRRIFALSKLVFKQAARIKSLWITFILIGALPFLFPAQWFASIRPEDELKVNIGIVAFISGVLILVISGIMSSFSLPNDIKNQTVHTIVTKPVERFEIVLGLFFGFVALMTLVLGGLTAVSLLLLRVNSFDQSAAEQTLKARMPIRGKLEFRSSDAKFEGTNVGKEFEYRKYIKGHEVSPERAIWKFYSIPQKLENAPDDRVPIEVMFDIFRLTKGSEDRGGSGVSVSLRFVTSDCQQRLPERLNRNPTGEWPWANAERQAAYNAELQQLRAEGKNPTDAAVGSPGWKAANELAEKYGIYEISGKPIANNRVITWNIPAGLFRNAFKNPPKDGQPTFEVYVKCESGGQMLGMAEPDLYLLGGTQRFEVNYVKSVVGLWCRVVLVIGLAIACSTYLSGVISLLVTAFLFLCGYFTELLQDLALNRNVGGGPFDAMSRVLKAELPTAPAGDTAGARVVQTLDKGFSWVIRRFQNLVPDVESLSWTDFVSEGFNINAEYLVVNLLVVGGYLLPWGILSYYLMKSREIASS
jgi:hypothetical protein